MFIKPYPWKQERQKYVIGVDEVGRGCLAGPVYAAAVILNRESCNIQGLTDSKKISAPRREILKAQIQRDCLVGIGFASVQEIEEINILWASLLAMRRAIENLPNWPLDDVCILVDGNRKIKDFHEDKQITLIKGDLRAQPIAAASIVAKVTRDELLKKMGESYPQYGFEKHKGYSTVIHKEAIKKWGPCKHHRPSFAGVKEFI